MKKQIAFILAAALSFSLAACGNTDESSSKGKKDKNSDSSSISESSSQEETTTTTTTAETTTTTTTTTAETTTTTVTEPAKEYSIAAIVGDWYIDGDPSTAHLSIHEDGSFESYLATGALEYEGTVTAGEYDLGDMSGKGDYFCLSKNDDENFKFYIPYTDAQAVEFTTVGSVGLHFLPLQEVFEMPEDMPYNFTCALNRRTGVDMHIEADGTFEGMLIGYDLDDKNERVEYFSHYVGYFSSPEKQTDGSYTFEIKSIQTVADIPQSTSYYSGYVSEDARDASGVFGCMGLANGQKVQMFTQGTKYKSLPKDFVALVKPNEEKDDMISDVYLWFEDAGCAFRAE